MTQTHISMTGITSDSLTIVSVSLKSNDCLFFINDNENQIDTFKRLEVKNT